MSLHKISFVCFSWDFYEQISENIGKLGQRMAWDTQNADICVCVFLI